MLGYSFAKLLIVDLLFSTPQPEGHQLLSLALKITVIADAKNKPSCKEDKFNVSPRGAILLPSSPLELTPADRTSPSAAGRTSPSPRSRASLLLQEARLSVLLLLLPLQTHDREASLQI